MHDLRENFFLNGKRRRGKSGEQGTENAGTKEEEEGKATGKRGIEAQAHRPVNEGREVMG